MKPQKNEDGSYIVYSYCGFNFCNYSDAYLFRSFLLAYNSCTPDEDKKISKGVHLFGHPDFINVDESIRKLKIVYYKDDEIDWGD